MNLANAPKFKRTTLYNGTVSLEQNGIIQERGACRAAQKLHTSGPFTNKIMSLQNQPLARWHITNTYEATKLVPQKHHDISNCLIWETTGEASECTKMPTRRRAGLRGGMWCSRKIPPPGERRSQQYMPDILTPLPLQLQEHNATDTVQPRQPRETSRSFNTRHDYNQASNAFAILRGSRNRSHPQLCENARHT